MKSLSTRSLLAFASTLSIIGAGSVVASQQWAETIPTSLGQATSIAQAEAMPLAKKLQGKPVVVDIYASWCPGCQNIAPTLAALKQQYAGKANFVVLDVTDRRTTQAATKMARELGLAAFLATNKSATSTVAIIDPATGKILKQYRNNPELSAYTSILDRSIAKMGAGAAMKK